MTPEDELWWHQARLLASSIRRSLRKGKEAARDDKLWAAPSRLEDAISTTELLVWHLTR